MKPSTKAVGRRLKLILKIRGLTVDPVHFSQKSMCLKLLKITIRDSRGAFLYVVHLKSPNQEKITVRKKKTYIRYFP